MSKITKEQVISILEQFGFKLYNAGKERYFLQSRATIKPMTKLPMEKALEIFNGKEEVVEKPKKAKKTKEVAKDE